MKQDIGEQSRTDDGDTHAGCPPPAGLLRQDQIIGPEMPDTIPWKAGQPVAPDMIGQVPAKHQGQGGTS